MFAGNRKADALRAAGAREDRGVDADELAAEIDQRAAGIAGIDRGVGLDEELIVGDADLCARDRRDDAVRHGLADAERIADREHQVADLQRVGIGEFERRKLFVRALMRSTARSVRASLSTISASNSRLSESETLTSLGAFDHVVVGDDEAADVDDDARAERPLHLLGRGRRDAPKKRRKNGSSNSGLRTVAVLAA